MSLFAIFAMNKLLQYHNNFNNKNMALLHDMANFITSYELLT